VQCAFDSIENKCHACFTALESTAEKPKYTPIDCLRVHLDCLWTEFRVQTIITVDTSPWMKCLGNSLDEMFGEFTGTQDLGIHLGRMFGKLECSELSVTKFESSELLVTQFESSELSITEFECSKLFVTKVTKVQESELFERVYTGSRV